MLDLGITGIPLTNHLAPAPSGGPRYALEVKNLKGEVELLGDPRATRALLALMNQHAVIGGAACHWGGPAALAEIMSSLHGIMFRQRDWFNYYNFVNDAGHTENGIYALRANYGFDELSLEDLKGFRSIESKLTGHGEAHVNPEGVFISNGPLGSGLPQAQGLALAEHLLGRGRTTICTISDGGCMEGEAREALAAIPGFARQNRLGPFILLVSDNNTKLSGRIDKGSFSMAPTFDSLDTLGWELEKIEDGHNLQKVHLAIDRAIERVRENPANPIALVFKTVKGKGVRRTEEASSGGHGHPLKARDPQLMEFINEIYEGDSPPKEFSKWASELMEIPPPSTKSNSSVPKEKVQAGLGRAAIGAAQKGLPVFSISADLQGSTGIGAFHKEFPERSLDVGVAEANMISTAIGLSKCGFIPIVDTFAQFGVTKGNLPLIMASLSQGPVIALFSHTGLQDAADGASHQATTYFSAVSSIPNTTVINCSCSGEAEFYLVTAIDKFYQSRKSGQVPESTIFFMGRETFPVHYTDNPQYSWKDVQIIGSSGKDLTLVASGPMLEVALRAQELLNENNMSAILVNAPFVNSTNIKTLVECLDKTGGNLITLEDHQLIAGQGAMLSHALASAGYSFKLKSLAVQGEFGRSAYKADHLYQSHCLTPSKVLEAACELLG